MYFAENTRRVVRPFPPCARDIAKSRLECTMYITHPRDENNLNHAAAICPAVPRIRLESRPRRQMRTYNTLRNTTCHFFTLLSTLIEYE